jgi:hypothetical protein
MENMFKDFGIDNWYDFISIHFFHRNSQFINFENVH